MKCVVESAGSVASTATLGSHTMLFDQPRSVPGGEDSGPSPLDVMVASVGACAHYFAAAFLLARRIAADGLRVVAIAEKERDPSHRISKLCLHVTLPASVPEQYTDPIEKAIRACPAFNTLVHPTNVAVELQREASISGP
ncbi:MAG TPA: OsmC family protein [Polyangiaceae bacterium]|nr:OsmC family protein [Polyangiaceae bacterium]